MALQIRRVVTGHDISGRAIVKIDEVAKNLVSSRPGATACVVWTTEGFPVDNTAEEDAGLRKTGTTLDNGTVFRILELAPGVIAGPTATPSGRRHPSGRTVFAPQRPSLFASCRTRPARVRTPGRRIA